MSELLSLIAEPRRSALMRLLWNGEKSAGELSAALPDISFGAVSQHLARLLEAKVVRVRKEGRARIYSVNRDTLGPLARALDEMWGVQLARLKHLAEEEHRRTRHARN